MSRGMGPETFRLVGWRRSRQAVIKDPVEYGLPSDMMEVDFVARNLRAVLVRFISGDHWKRHLPHKGLCVQLIFGVFGVGLNLKCSS